MKNLYIIILIILSNYTFAQRSGNAHTIFSNIGIKTNIGTSIITNTDIANDESVNFKNMEFYYSYGLTASLSYMGMKPKNIIFSIQAEFMRGNFSHSFSKIETDTKINYTKNIDYTIDNRILVLRYENVKHNLFVGLGFKNSVFMNINEQNSIQNDKFYSEKENYNLINFYHNYNSLILEIGLNIKNILISIRYTNPVSDMNKELRNPLYDGVYNDLTINETYKNKYYSDSKTKHYTVLLTLSYRIPFISFGRATSGNDGISFFKKADKNFYWNK